VNIELESMWVEAVPALFKVMCRGWGLRKTTKDLSQTSQSVGQDLKPGLNEYKTEVLTTQP
jgi:hypothetical protein